MNIFKRDLWKVGEVEVPLQLNNATDRLYVITKALKIQSQNPSLEKMYFIPRKKQQPLFLYEEDSLIVTVALDIYNIEKEAITPDKSRTLSGRMINDCDLLHNNISAAEAFFTGLCMFAECTNLVLPVDVYRHQAHFVMCAMQMDKKKLHGEYHQLILSFCDRLLEQFSYAIALNHSGNF